MTMAPTARPRKSTPSSHGLTRLIMGKLLGRDGIETIPYRGRPCRDCAISRPSRPGGRPATIRSRPKRSGTARAGLPEAGAGRPRHGPGARGRPPAHRVAGGDDVPGDALHDLLGHAARRRWRRRAGPPPWLPATRWGNPRARRRARRGRGSRRKASGRRPRPPIPREPPFARARSSRRVVAASALDAAPDPENVRRHAAVRLASASSSSCTFFRGSRRARVPIASGRSRASGAGRGRALEQRHAVRDDVHGRAQRAPRALRLALVLHDDAGEARSVVRGPNGRAGPAAGAPGSARATRSTSRRGSRRRSGCPGARPRAGPCAAPSRSRRGPPPAGSRSMRASRSAHRLLRVARGREAEARPPPRPPRGAPAAPASETLPAPRGRPRGRARPGREGPGAGAARWTGRRPSRSCW